MGLSQNIKNTRQSLKLSQGYVADQLGVSRQAVSKWESGQTEPTAENLAELAALFEVSIAELVGRQEDDKLILHMNLTNIAIAMQVGELHACTNALAAIERAADPLRLSVNLGALLLCSLWMVRNLFYEKDPEQRRKNARIELLYCLVQLSVAFLTLRWKLGLVGFLVHVAVLFVYLYDINPRWMNRAFSKKGIARLREEKEKNGSM